MMRYIKNIFLNFVLISFTPFFMHCGGMTSGNNVNNPIPPGTYVSASNCTPPTSIVASLYSQSNESFAIRIQILSSFIPDGTTPLLLVYGTGSTPPILNTPLRSTSGTQNYYVTTATNQKIIQIQIADSTSQNPGYVVCTF